MNTKTALIAVAVLVIAIIAIVLVKKSADRPAMTNEDNVVVTPMDPVTGTPSGTTAPATDGPATTPAPATTPSFPTTGFEDAE